MQSSYRYLLFDLDGTLTDSAPGIVRCVRFALERLGVDVPLSSDLRSFVGPPLVDSFRKIGLSEARTAEAVALFRGEYESKGILENSPYAGVAELLSALSAAGYRLAVATSKPEEMAVRVLRRFDLERWFSTVCGGESDGPGRTKAGVIERVLKLERIEERRMAAMIGDRCHDVEGAHTAGIDAIGVLWGYGTREELERAGVVGVAERPDDLMQWFI